MDKLTKEDLRDILNKYGLNVSTKQEIKKFIKMIEIATGREEFTFYEFNKKLEVDFNEGLVGECYPTHLEGEEITPELRSEEEILKAIHNTHTLITLMLNDGEEWIIFIKHNIYKANEQVIKSKLETYFNTPQDEE